MFTNEIRPYKSNAYHRHKSCDALRVAHMCVLDVESGGFHGLESRLNLPAFLIGQDSAFGTVEAYENLQFRDTVGVFDSAAGKIDILAFVKKKLMEEFLLPDPEVIEEPPCTYPLTGGRPDNPEVLPYTDIIPDTSAVQPSYPFLTYELPVSHETIDTVRSKKEDEPLHDFLSLFPIGISPFGEQAENQRKGNPFVCYAQHKDIDVEVPELPVGAVHAQHKPRLDWEQSENHTCDNIKVKNILGEESLKPSEIGILFDRCRHGVRQLMEADSLYDAERMEKIRHELYTRQIHRFSKMCLHNREDLINFDQVLGSSSFHGEKSANFSFKLLIFRDFCKYNRLNFRCLTA